jgi:hypothetical protein
VDVRRGTHLADSESITVAAAGRLWLESGDRAGLERTTLDSYRQHLNFHIVPILGAMKLSQLTVPMVRAQPAACLRNGGNTVQHSAKKTMQQSCNKIGFFQAKTILAHAIIIRVSAVQIRPPLPLLLKL